MTIRQSIYFLTILIFTTSACSEKVQTPLKAYFYPLDLMSDTLVYVYSEPNLNEQTYEQFYYDKTSKKLHQISYNADFEKTQDQIFRIIPDGVLLDEMILYDSSFIFNEELNEFAKEVSVEHGQIFHFNLRDSMETLIYHISWDGQKPEKYRLDLIKNRYCNCNDRSDDNLLKLEVNGLIEDTRQGTLSLKLKGYEVYQKNKGLIEIYSDYQNGLILNYHLQRVMNMKEFRKSKKEILG